MTPGGIATRRLGRETAAVTADAIATLPAPEFTRKVWSLYRRALPDETDPALFNRLMREVGGKGMSYVEALQYVVIERGIAPINAC